MSICLIRFFCRVTTITLVALAMVGCSTTAMKGTPFFTGEYAQRTGPAEDRINLWPLLYYREPALSMMWPLGEYSGDRLAVRPFFSIEKLDQDQRIYNVLWPLGRFDTQGEEYRFFPFFWGRDHRIVFPLYWHFDEPFAVNGTGSDSLWPLWCYFHDHRQYSLHLLWPFFNTKSYDNESGLRLWPLYGSYEQPRNNTGYSYALWPLAWHTWNKEESTWTLIPLFHNAREPHVHTFGTLLGGWHHDQDADTTAWYALPILGWGSSTPDASSASALLGLYSQRRDHASSSSHLIPLYYHTRNAERSLFLSPIYVAHVMSDDEAWRMVVPLAIHRRSSHGTSFYSLFYSQGSETTTQTRWSCLLPLYYEEQGAEGSTFITALGGWWSDANHKNWAVYPLLSGGRRRIDGGDLWIGGPLFRASWDAAGTSHRLLPFYSYKHDSGTFLSPLYSAWDNDEEGTTRLLPPLLSSYATRTNRWDLWLLAGLGHASGGLEGGSNHLLPLYYSNPRRDLFLSPLYAAWDADVGRMRAVPFLLSAWYADSESREIIGVLGLFRARWGAQATSNKGHLFPLYYYDHKTLVTPLIGHWEDHGVVNRYWLTPLLGTRTGQGRGSWFVPFYSHTTEAEGQFAHGWFLGLGEYERSPYESCTRFPLLFEHERWRRDTAAARDGWRFNALLLAQGASYDYTETRAPSMLLNEDQVAGDIVNEPMHRNECRFFPLWSYKSDLSVTGVWQRASGSLLLCLYDYRRERGRLAPEMPAHDYTRRRVLFRLYHHERLNGATSIDIFPGITYDCDPTEDKRKFSLLWRLFRYVHTPEKRAVDLLFLPIWRSHTDVPEQATL